MRPRETFMGPRETFMGLWETFMGLWRASLLACLLLWAALNSLEAQVFLGDSPVDTATVVSGLDTPWEILWGPDDHLWITERRGRVSRIDPVSGQLNSLGSIPEVYETGESGLLGMALHPDFPDTSRIFVVYNYLDGGSIKERLASYQVGEGSLSDPVVLLEDIPGASNHNGSRLLIDAKRMLYMTTGDAVNTSLSQNVNSLAGKVLRMHLDGSIPEDNPIPGSLVWSWGHRNAQGLVSGPSGILYSSEHGPSSDDEVNIIEGGRNYGWPQVKGFCNDVTEEAFCTDSSVVEPIAAWTPTLAVSGADFYAGQEISSLHNSVLVTSLKSRRLVALTMSEDGRTVLEEEQYIQGWFGRLRDLCISPSGELYLATSNRDGRGTPGPLDDRIIRFSPAGGGTGLDSPQLREALQVLPNPVQGTLFTLHHPPAADQAILKIYAQNGALIHTREISPGLEKTTIELALSTGIYLLRMEGLDFYESTLLIKH